MSELAVDLTLRESHALANLLGSGAIDRWRCDGTGLQSLPNAGR